MSCSLRAFTVATLASALLAACGGGGGGGSSSPVSPGLPQSIAITESNAKPVAADALENVRNTSATRAATGLPLGVQVDARSAGSTAALAYAVRMASTVMRGAALPVGVQVSQTVACPMGGTMTVSGHMANPATLTPGDTLTVMTSNCRDNSGGMSMTMNGQFSMTFVSGTMDVFPFHAVLQMTATNFAVMSGAMTATSTGDIRLDWSATSTAMQTMMATGASMSTTELVGGQMRQTTMTNYTQTITMNGTLLSTQLSAGIESGNMQMGMGMGGGKYTLSTPTPVTWDSMTMVVSAGVIRAVGANNSQLLLTINADSSVTIQVDANGDGTYEKTLTSTVAELGTLI